MRIIIFLVLEIFLKLKNNDTATDNNEDNCSYKLAFSIAMKKILSMLMSDVNE